MTIESFAGRALKMSFVCVLSLAMPAMVHASVSITEIMYNPDGTDTGREWIELYNDGSSDVTIVGGSGSGSWRVVDSANHTITLDLAKGVGRGSLVVPAGGYLVISTDPATFVGEYSGSYSVAKSSLSLTNTGTTVSLVDGTGETIDSVTYTASQGGSDNGTSLQLASSTWLQALPTPGAANAAEAYNPPAEEGSSGSSSGTSGSSSNPGFVAPPLPQVFANAGSDRTVIVGADSKFVATAYDRDRDVINYAKFFWNFGDGTTAEGPWVMHHYSYPGRYSVQLTITNTSLRTTSYITVTAEPASVALESLPMGGVSIKNNAGRDLDVSFWQIRQGEQTFALPEYSMVLKGSSLNISAQTLGFEAAQARLYYPDGTEVAAGEQAVVVPDTAVPAAESSESDQSSIEVSGASGIYAPLITAGRADEVASTTEPAPEAFVAAVSDSGVELPWLPIMGLGGLVGLGIASVVSIRRKPVTGRAAGEFTIE